MFWNSCGACDAGVPLFVEENWSKEDPRQSRRSSMADTLFAQRISGDEGAEKSVSVLLRCEAPVLDGWRDSRLADNDIVAVVAAPIVDIIAACFKAAEYRWARRCRHFQIATD